MTWINCKDRLPPEKLEVMTKIDDKSGVRNETTLCFYQNLWFHPDLSMYIYYQPTHWKLLNKS